MNKFMLLLVQSCHFQRDEAFYSFLVFYVLDKIY